MNISFSWLKEYIKTDLTPAEVAEILTSIGLEVGGVEEFETIKGGLEGLVVGEVLTCEPHENSDHLHVTTVNVGEAEPLQIVCGAPNVAKGQKVVVATVGTRLYQGEESFQIKRSKIRGVESFGMICSETEIGVGSSHAGIIVLPSDVAVGALAKDYYQIEKDTFRGGACGGQQGARNQRGGAEYRGLSTLCRHLHRGRGGKGFAGVATEPSELDRASSNQQRGGYHKLSTSRLRTATARI